MGAVAESGEATATSNTIIIGSDTGQDQQDRGERSEGLTETASRYGRDMGRRTLEAYEQGREGVSNAAGQAWDAAERTGRSRSPAEWPGALLGSVGTRGEPLRRRHASGPQSASWLVT